MAVLVLKTEAQPTYRSPLAAIPAFPDDAPIAIDGHTRSLARHRVFERRPAQPPDPWNGEAPMEAVTGDADAGTDPRSTL
ncbi:MAG: hypothetical protein AMXMBFR76_16650 [Pseudomonadota bacterium]|jgi:hypothetical protein